MKKINYKKVLYILEKVAFIIAVVVVIIIANGYIYDPTKRELIQTGVLELRNIQDNTIINFNNQKSTNKNSLVITSIEEGKYNLKISKQNRLPYSTNVQIKKGEKIYIDPVLVSKDLTKSTTVIRDNASNITGNDKALFYTYTDGTSTFLERLLPNKTIFNIDINKTPLNITQIKNQEKDLNVIAGDTTNYAIITTSTKKTYLADFNKLTTVDLTPFLPLQEVNSIKLLNDYILISYSDTLYSVSISDPTKIQRVLIFNGTDYTYSYDENNNIVILNKINGAYSLEIYTPAGIQNSKTAIQSTDALVINKLFTFNKEIYILANNNLYKIENNAIRLFIEKINDAVVVDPNTLLLVNDETIKLIQREKINEYDYANSHEINKIQLMNDQFTFVAHDKENNLFIGDIGGQRTNLTTISQPNLVAVQNGTNTYIFYTNENKIMSLRLGND